MPVAVRSAATGTVLAVVAARSRSPAISGAPIPVGDERRAAAHRPPVAGRAGRIGSGFTRKNAWSTRVPEVHERDAGEERAETDPEHRAHAEASVDGGSVKSAWVMSFSDQMKMNARLSPPISGSDADEEEVLDALEDVPAVVDHAGEAGLPVVVGDHQARRRRPTSPGRRRSLAWLTITSAANQSDEKMPNNQVANAGVRCLGSTSPSLGGNGPVHRHRERACAPRAGSSSGSWPPTS